MPQQDGPCGGETFDAQLVVAPDQLVASVAPASACSAPTMPALVGVACPVRVVPTISLVCCVQVATNYTGWVRSLAMMGKWLFRWALHLVGM